MANFLEQLALGLRQAGGVLNPEVQRETFAADERAAAQQASQRQQLMLMQQQHLLQQATPQAQLQLQHLENERKFQKAYAEADGDELKIATAAGLYKPELAVSLLKNKEDRAARLETAAAANETRKAQIEAQLQNQQLTREMQAELARQRDETARRGQDLQREIANARNDTQRMIASLRPPRQERLVPVDQGDGNTVYMPASEAVGAKVPKKAGGDGKPLPTKLQSDLLEQGKILDASERFTSSFKPDYGGFVSDKLGNITLAAERKLSGDTGRTQWWQDYELHQSVVRNKLFGSALTAPEIAAWEKSSIGPGMHPDQIKANLARRENIERAGLTRLARSSATTYNKTAIEEAIGRPIPEASGPTTIKSDADYAKLPSGAEFIAPDGSRRRKP